MFTSWRERSWSLRPPWKSGFLLLLIWRSTLITHDDHDEDENQVCDDIVMRIVKIKALLLLIWRSTLITHHDECEDENQVAVDDNCNKNDENQVTLVADMEVITHDDDCEDENQVAVDDDCDENYENLVTLGDYYECQHL